MKNTLLVVFLFTIALYTSCMEEEKRNAGTIENFQENLRKEMSYESIVLYFGKPARDMGSGIHIYVYELKDSTQVWIGFTDSILYAQHRDKDQLLLATLL